MKNAAFALLALGGLVGLAILDLWVLRTYPFVSLLSVRFAICAVLLALNVLAVCLLAVLGGLVIHGAAGLPLLVFVLVGGVAAMLILLTSIVAPVAFFDSYDLIAGAIEDLLLPAADRSLIAEGKMGQPRYGPVVGGILALVIVTPVILAPALLAALASRGVRVELSSTRESVS